MKIKDLIQYLKALDIDLEIRLEDEDGQHFEATQVLKVNDFKNNEVFIVIK